MEPSSSPVPQRKGQSGTFVVSSSSDDTKADQVHTDYYAVVPSAPASASLIIVPGNPGVTDFYTVFADSLFEAFGSKYPVIVIGQAGHGAPGLNGSRLFTVEDQIKHKISFLRSYIGGSYNSIFFSTPQGASPIVAPHKLILLGHSIGAYMSLKVRARASDLPITGVVGLMPTLRHLWQGFTPFIKTFTTWPFRDLISYVGHWLPVPIAHIASRFGTDAEFGHQLDGVLRKKLNYYSLNNILYMAHLEGRDILDIDEELTDTLNEAPKQTLLLYSSKDKYTPSQFIDDMREKFPEVHVFMAQQEVEHAFVTRSGHARSVAQHVEYLARTVSWNLED